MLFQKTRAKKSAAFRSPERDVAVDASRIKTILDVIERVAREATTERDGLRKRLSDVIALSSVTIGSGSDDYLTRDPVEDEHQTALGAEIRYAETRLKVLDETIAYYDALQAFTASAWQTRCAAPAGEPAPSKDGEGAPRNG